MGAMAGWYQDPDGSGHNRYWDGNAWHAAIPATSMPRTPKWLQYALIAGVVLVFVVLFIPRGGSSGAQDDVIDTCQSSIRKGLRDPDSAKFDEWKAWPAPNSTPPIGLEFHPSDGDKFYSAAGTVNAKNGFGGYVGARPYSCSAVVTNDGTVRAQTTSLGGELPGS